MVPCLGGGPAKKIKPIGLAALAFYAAISAVYFSGRVSGFAATPPPSLHHRPAGGVTAVVEERATRATYLLGGCKPQSRAKPDGSVDAKIPRPPQCFP